MAIKIGRYGAVKLGGDAVSKMAEWSLDGITTDTIESTAFGDSYKQYEIGLSDYGTLSFRGHYDPDDTTGQKILESALLAGSKLSNLRLYIDSLSYWTPDATNGAGVYITSMKIALTNAGIGSIDFAGRCTGKMIMQPETAGESPSASPSASPSKSPSASPSKSPSASPSASPSKSPSASPSASPS